MKVCPVCKAEYPDDVEACANDGEPLLEGGEVLPDNPELHDVLEVSPDEATAMVDLESLQPKIKERLEEKAERDAERRARDAERREREEREADPDATGTLMAPDLDSLRGRRHDDDDDDFDPEQDSTALLPAPPGGGAVPGDPDAFAQAGPTQVVPRAPGPKKSSKGLIAAVIVLFGVFGAAGLAVGLYFAFGPGKGVVLTVTTVPPKASVRLDGKDIGLSPLQERVKPGSHTVELQLEGYESFKEVIDVPPEGLPFIQPLKALPGTRTGGDDDSAGPADAGAASDDDGSDAGAAPEPGGNNPKADKLAAAAERLLEKGDIDGALGKIKSLMKLAPDDPRADALFDRATEARAQGGQGGSDEPGRRGRGGRKGRRGGGSADKPDDDDGPIAVPVTGDKKQLAQEAYEEGERLFKNGRNPEAKRQFKLSIQLNPNYYLPHRSIARIYQREGNVRSARYHLQRYLKLGGPDPDFRVRQWLEKNPP